MAIALRGPKATAYAKTLADIDSLISPLEIPTETRVFVGRRLADSRYAEDMNIYVGLRSRFMESVDPGVEQGPLAHEYSHVLLEKNLLKNLEIYRNFRQSYFSLIQRILGKANEAKNFSASCQCIPELKKNSLKQKFLDSQKK